VSVAQQSASDRNAAHTGADDEDSKFQRFQWTRRP
jgi:hypothetical protein